jgi:hypothetical protein
MFCHCSISGNLLVIIQSCIIFFLSPICLFEGMLCFPVVWCVSNTESVACVLPILS